MNSIMKKDNEEQNSESTDEIDEENKVEIEEIENEVGANIQVIRPHVPIPNYSSYDNKMRPEPADKSTYDNNQENFESAVTVSHEDNLNIKEKQKIKELEAEQNTIEDGKVVQEKKDKESINSKILPKKNEFSDIISTINNSSINTIETEGENPERDKKLIGEPDKRHKITKESLQKNRKVEQNPEFINKTSNREKYVTEMLKIEGENPERDKETTKKQDKIQYTTKEAPMDKNNEKPNFHNENYSEEELKTNKNNNGKIFERIDKTDEENKTTEKMKNG